MSLCEIAHESQEMHDANVRAAQERMEAARVRERAEFFENVKREWQRIFGIELDSEFNYFVPTDKNSDPYNVSPRSYLRHGANFAVDGIRFKAYEIINYTSSGIKFYAIRDIPLEINAWDHFHNEFPIGAPHDLITHGFC